MKRAGIRRGKKGLKRDTPASRAFADSRSELSRRTEAAREFIRRGRESSARSLDEARRRKPPRPKEGPLTPWLFRLAAYAASDGWCRITRSRADGPEDPRYDAHHLVPKRMLRERGLFAHVWDPRNALWIAQRAHGRHESGFQRIPRRLVPRAAWEFAEEMDELCGTQWATETLRRLYPDD